MILLRAGLLLSCLQGLATCTSILCSDQSFCQQQLGPDSHCKISESQGNCSCNPNYYLEGSDDPYCTQCPGVGESCEQSQCCSKGLVCRQGVCFCAYINEFCWTVNDSERIRFQRVAQCILAVAVILTMSILFFLFWKACTRRDVANRHLSRGSFQSLNSIQRLVLMQLQDRPPRYSAAYLHPCKNPNEFLDSPPSYIEALGHDNAVFALAEYPGITSERSTTAANTALQNQLNCPEYINNSVNVPMSSHSSQISVTTSNANSPVENPVSSDTSSIPVITTLNTNSPPVLSETYPTLASNSTNSDLVNAESDLNKHVTLHI